MVLFIEFNVFACTPEQAVVAVIGSRGKGGEVRLSRAIESIFMPTIRRVRV